MSGKGLKCRSDPCILAWHQQAKEDPFLPLALALGTLTIHLVSGPGEAQTTAVQVYNNSQERLCILCGLWACQQLSLLVQGWLV